MSDKTYLTFGQDHIHSIGGVIYNKDCVVVFDLPEKQAREKAHEYFGDKWFTTYKNEPDMVFFPRGLMEVT